MGERAGTSHLLKELETDLLERDRFSSDHQKAICRDPNTGVVLRSGSEL